MIEHTLSPFLIQFTDSIGIRWYSLAYIFGFIITYYFLKHAIKQNQIKNMTFEKLDSLIIWIAVSMIIGARFFHVFIFEWSFYKENLGLILQIWNGGLSFHGALVGIAIATIWFCKKNNVKFYDIADVIVIPAALGLFLGRIANFINGELYGTLSSSAICVNYENNTHIHNPPEGCRHPTQLFEAAKNLFIFFVLFFSRKNFKLKPGFIFWSFVTLYGLIRFILMYFRDESILVLGMTQSQIFSLIMFIVGVIMLYKRR